MFLKRSFLLAASLLLMLFMAACNLDGGYGNTPSSTANMNAKTTPTAMANDQNMMGTATPTANAMNDNNGMNATPTANAMGNNNGMNATPTANAMDNNNNNMGNNDMNPMIKTTQVMLNGKAVTVLTTANGMMLYYKLDDPRPMSACTGMCAKDWPPLLSNDMNITSSMMLPKKLSVYKTANGNQVEYDGHPLYTYVGDMKPGQYTGRGMDNVWYLVGIGL